MKTRLSEVILDVTPLQTDHRFRGIGAYVRGLLKGLAELGYSVRTWGFAEPFDGGVAPDRRVHRLVQGHRWAHLQIIMLGGRTIPRDTYVHLTSVTSAGLRTGDHIATVYDFIPLLFPHAYLPSRYARRRYDRYLRHLRDAAHLVAISDSVAREASEVLDRSPASITVALPGVPELPMPAELPLLEYPYVFVPATTEPHKNLAFAIDVVASITPSLRPALIVTGAAKAQQEWERLELRARRLGVRLLHLGFLSRAQMSGLYRDAEAVLIPSLYEGFGLTALEALAAGSRVFVSDRGSLPEVVGGAGVVLPLEVDLWVDRLLELLYLGEPTDASELRAKAGEFSWHRTARSVLNAYRAAGVWER